jgi:DNA-binding beta-propeller fold protein YncE
VLRRRRHADTKSTTRSARPPSATTTGATLPAFARDRFAAVIPVPGAGSLAVAGGKVWVLDASGTVVGIDPVTNAAVGEPLRVPANAEAIAVADGALWVASVAPGDLAAPGDDAVTRIDLATGRTVATITVRRGPLDITATRGAVWVANSGAGGDSVARIDPQTNRLVGRPVRTGDSPQSLAVGGGSLWVANHDARTVTRIHPAGGKVVADIPVPSEPHRVAYGAGAAWVGNWHDNSVSRIDPATNRVVGPPIPIGSHHAGNLVVGAGSVWVTSDYRENAAAEDVWLCASTRRPTERSRRSPWVATRSMSPPPRARSGCRSQTPAPCYGSPGANSASRTACVWLRQPGRAGWRGGPPGSARAASSEAGEIAVIPSRVTPQ